jgi:hypothetical protein
MGASGSVQVKAVHIDVENGEFDVDAELKNLFADKDHMAKLYSEICLSAEKDRINVKSKISCANLLHYHCSMKNPLFSKLIINQSILLEAHKFACSKKARSSPCPQLTKGRFKNLLCAIYYFSHLWRVFSTLDCIVVDNKLHKGELLKFQQLVNQIAGVEVILHDLTKQDVEDEFLKIDKDKSGSITFDEFVLWCVDNISSPECFSEDLVIDKHDVDDVDEEFKFSIDDKIVKKLLCKGSFFSTKDLVMAVELEQAAAAAAAAAGLQPEDNTNTTAEVVPPSSVNALQDTSDSSNLQPTPTDAVVSEIVAQTATA